MIVNQPPLYFVNNHEMKRFIAIFSVIVVSASIALSAATSAAAVLKKTADNIKASPSITAKFSMSEGRTATNGTLTISGDKFVISAGSSGTTWYNGKDQWVYNPAADEMTLSSPTPDELATINPFVIIASFQKNYKARMLKAVKVGTHTIELLPNSKNAEISKAVITIDANNCMPVSAAIAMSNGHTATIKISSITKGKKLPLVYFQPDKNKYSSAEWIDLR